MENEISYIEISYRTDFGDETRFSTNIESPDIDSIMAIFCRFLLAAGWTWENVKQYHPDYMHEVEHENENAQCKNE